MKRGWIALALVFTMVGSLTACGRKTEDTDQNTAKQTRTSSIHSQTRQFIQDGSYWAGKDGQLRDDSRDRTGEMEESLKDMMRKAGDAAKDAGERIGSAARDAENNMKTAAGEAAKE